MNIVTPTVAADLNCRGTTTIAPDPRLTFLARASARLILVEVGEMDIAEAFDGLIEAVEVLAPCQCDRELLDRWEGNYPPQKRGGR
jgi:hypothetical protein